jgi:hypothetical protein
MKGSMNRECSGNIRGASREREGNMIDGNIK